MGWRSIVVSISLLTWSLLQRCCIHVHLIICHKKVADQLHKDNDIYVIQHRFILAAKLDLLGGFKIGRAHV